MEYKAFKAKIAGRVQGVGFRFFVIDKSREYGVTGYTKNLFDGSVEVYAEGEKQILDEFLTDLRRGPSLSRVDKINVDWLEAEQKYRDFRIEF